eukprot:s779_g23.t1
MWVPYHTTQFPGARRPTFSRPIVGLRPLHRRFYHRATRNVDAFSVGHLKRFVDVDVDGAASASRVPAAYPVSHRSPKPRQRAGQYDHVQARIDTNLPESAKLQSVPETKVQFTSCDEVAPANRVESWESAREFVLSRFWSIAKEPERPGPGNAGDLFALWFDPRKPSRQRVGCAKMFHAMKWLPFLVTVQAESTCDQDLSMSFLQKQHALEIRTERTECGYLINGSLGDVATFFNNNCKYHSHGDECSRPIPDVMAEHPGMDGFCYFSDVAMYIQYSPPSNDPRARIKDAFGGAIGLRGPGYKGLNTGPMVTYHHNGKAIISHMDSENYVYDDLYGYSLGLLQGQGRTVEQLKDPAVWDELARAKCEELQKIHQFTHDELVLGDILDMNMPLMAMSHCTAGWEMNAGLRNSPYVTEKAQYHNSTDCKKVTDREYARHHYMKCLLGINNAAGDAAYLFARACLLDGGSRIGHFSECPFNLEIEGVL